MISEHLVDLSRLQFAATALYHFLFVPLTLGMVWLLVIMESVYVMTNKVIWKDMTRFWGKLFGINFALGVTTGCALVQPTPHQGNRIIAEGLRRWICGGNRLCHCSRLPNDDGPECLQSSPPPAVAGRSAAGAFRLGMLGAITESCAQWKYGNS